jgi:hypothetical protein
MHKSVFLALPTIALASWLLTGAATPTPPAAPSTTRPADYPYNPNLSPTDYKNPILFADYSDPDVVRVGDDYYMTASSFSCFPGLPILHSKDLVSWTIIGHAVQHYPEPQRQSFKLPQHGGGIWAPSIRYHDGTFYIFVADPDHGIWMTKTKDPKGPWSPLHLVQKSYGWIDTCPFWDDDGNAYLIHAFAASRAGLGNVLWLHKMAPDGTRLLDDGHLLFDARGTYTTLEGPKLYKRNGYYYVLAPGGGVANGYQIAFRSKSIDGPYEHRIVLDSGATNINGPHQGAWIDTPDGKEDWFIHFQQVLPYGRIIHLQPMRWENDWPVIGVPTNDPTKGQPALTHTKPTTPGSKLNNRNSTIPQTSDDFTSPTLGLQWQWWADFNESWADLKASPGNLRLPAVPTPTSSSGQPLPLYERPNLLLQKFPAETFTVTAKIDASRLAPSERAGLVLAGKTTAALQLERTGDGLKIIRTSFTYRPPAAPAARNNTTPRPASPPATRRFTDAPYPPVPPVTLKPLDPFPAPALPAPSTQPDNEDATATAPGTTVYLRLTCAPKGVCTLAYSPDNTTFTPLGSPVTAVNDTWIGAKVGLFCNAAASPAAGNSAAGSIDVDWFRFE